MVAVLLLVRSGLAAAMGKGGMIQEAAVISLAQDLSYDNESRLGNAFTLRRFGQRADRAGIGPLFRPRSLLDDSRRCIGGIAAAQEFGLESV